MQQPADIPCQPSCHQADGSVKYHERQDDAYDIARLAHQAEVLEFNEPGGMMDHFASSFGSTLYIDFSFKGGKQEPLHAKLGHFVLGDSQQPKDTKGILTRVKFGTLAALEILSKKEPGLNMQTISLDAMEKYKGMLQKEHSELLRGNIINRGLTQQAKKLFQQGNYGIIFGNHCV